MNLNFHHRRYAKCTKCHKTHKPTQHEPKISNERNFMTFLDSLNNEDTFMKNIGEETEENVEKILDEYSYVYENQSFPKNKYENEKSHQKSPINSNKNTSQRYQNLNLDDYTESYPPKNSTATTPLEKLKELQKQRASAESYYSQEIQKIISEHFISDYGSNNNRRSKSIEPDRRIRAGGTEDLEQCGIITTIARLDCGCVQKTKRPIFTTVVADIHAHQYYHCSDGEIEDDIDEAVLKDPINGQTGSHNNSLPFNHLPKRPIHDINTEQYSHEKVPRFDAINSTLKSENSKSFKDTFHRTNIS